MTDPPKIPGAVAGKLGHYVYLYVDPTDDSVFYVGKGKGARALAHLDDATRVHVAQRIEEIRAADEEPRIEILAHDLPSAEVALQVESPAIDLLGLGNLANAVRGWRSAKFGRMPLNELAAHYTRRRVEITEPAILIRITRMYRYGMTPGELYDATRSAWRVGRRRRERAELAVAIVEGVVREVYTIQRWLPGGVHVQLALGGSCGGSVGSVGVRGDDRARGGAAAVCERVRGASVREGGAESDCVCERGLGKRAIRAPFLSMRGEPKLRSSIAVTSITTCTSSWGGDTLCDRAPGRDKR